MGILANLFFIVREISHLILDDTPATGGSTRTDSADWLHVNYWRNCEVFTVLVFIVSLALAVHSVHLGLRTAGTQEASSLSLSVFFLICSAAWVAERELDVVDAATLDRQRAADTAATSLPHKLGWTAQAVTIRDAKVHVTLSALALVSSVVLTLTLILSSSELGITLSLFDLGLTLKLLLLIGLIVQLALVRAMHNAKIDVVLIFIVVIVVLS